MGVADSFHNSNCKQTFDRQDTIFTFSHPLYSGLAATEISKGSVDFDCFFFAGHSQFNTENVSWVLKPRKPVLPFSEISVVINQFLNPPSDQFEAVLEIKGQNFDEVNREWVTNHFQRELLFVAQNRPSVLTSLIRDQPLLLGATK